MRLERLNELMLHVLSRAAQLLYVEKSAAAYDLLIRANRFFRYAASPDRVVPLADEMRSLEDYRFVGGHGEAVSLRIERGPEVFPGSVFVERMALVAAVDDLALAGGDSEAEIRIAALMGESPQCCRVSRGSAVRTIKVS
jgi:hypothetical protein